MRWQWTPIKHMSEIEPILATVYRAVDSLNREQAPDRQVAKAPETRLYGADSVLDSLKLVTLIVEVEREVEDSCGVTVTIADERALSMKHSPFYSIQSLANYVRSLVDEAKHG